MTGPQAAHNADIALATKVFVEHEVMFMLDPTERYVVRRRHMAGYVLVGWITVHLHHDRRVWVTASGTICKKDGSPSAVTRMNETVDLPDVDRWIERARAALPTGGPDA